MKKRLVLVSIVFFLLGAIVSTSVAVFAMPSIGRAEPEQVVYAQTQEELDAEIAEAQSMVVMASDLFMALDIKSRLLSGEANAILFSDGTKIQLAAPPDVIAQIDNKIASLRSSLVSSVEAKKEAWAVK